MNDISKYKIEKIGKRGDIEIWLVDGTKIRNELDIEFTNFGQKFYQDEIPENEFWIDKEASPDERKFFIDRLLIERKLIDKGLEWDEIKDIASAKESAEREKRLKQRTKTKENLTVEVEIEKIRKELLGETKNGLSIWLADGNLIRSLLMVNFTEGGHHLVYDFVPENDVWIDNDMFKEEIPFVILHELYERDLMSKGSLYDDAHDGVGEIKGASDIEWEARHDRNKLKEYLSELGFKPSGIIQI